MKKVLKKSFNNDYQLEIDKAFSKLGVKVNDNIITSTNIFARLLCNMAVKDGLFKKISQNIFKLIVKKEKLNTPPPKGDMDPVSYGDEDKWERPGWGEMSG